MMESNQIVRNSLKHPQIKLALSESEGNQNDLGPNDAFPEFEIVPQLGYSCFLNESFSKSAKSFNSMVSIDSGDLLKADARDHKKIMSRLIFEESQDHQGKFLDQMDCTESVSSSNYDELDIREKEALEEDLADANEEIAYLKRRLKSKVEECENQREKLKSLENELDSKTTEIAHLRKMILNACCGITTSDLPALTQKQNKGKSRGIRGFFSKLIGKRSKNDEKQSQFDEVQIQTYLRSQMDLKDAKIASLKEQLNQQREIVVCRPQSNSNKRASFVHDDASMSCSGLLSDMTTQLNASVSTDVTYSVVTNDASEVSFSSAGIFVPPRN